jgi:hypothetical protein
MAAARSKASWAVAWSQARLAIPFQGLAWSRASSRRSGLNLMIPAHAAPPVLCSGLGDAPFGPEIPRPCQRRYWRIDRSWREDERAAQSHKVVVTVSIVLVPPEALRMKSPSGHKISPALARLP